MDKQYDSNWKPDRTLIGVYGGRGSNANKKGEQSYGAVELGRFEGKKGRIIMMILAYRVSQKYPSEAGKLTSCKEQVRSVLKKGILNPNPKTRFLQDLSYFIQKW